jgi:pyrroline-5-carboxylate reductase
MITQKLAIIGVGNMGKAIVSGLLAQKTIKPENLLLSDPHHVSLEVFEEQGIILCSTNEEAVDKADIILLAVKPQAFPLLLKELKNSLSKDQLIISIAAGIEIQSIKQAFSSTQPVVRVMPNLCATVGESMSVWVKSKEVTKEQEQVVKALLQAVGQEVLLDKEELIDAVTAISGSGPAYVFYLTELLEHSAQTLGIPEKAAKLLARQTIIGSAKVLGQSEKSAKELRLQVTSKGGTTEAAFEKFEESNLKKVFFNGIRAAHERAKVLKLS